jgi:hypothetical protein
MQWGISAMGLFLSFLGHVIGAKRLNLNGFDPVGSAVLRLPGRVRPEFLEN